MEFFKGAYIGMSDKNGNKIHEGDDVVIYYRGGYVNCKVIYKAEWGMFCLRWPDGYENKWPINSEKIEVKTGLSSPE